jgi:hypothetical protein
MANEYDYDYEELKLLELNRILCDGDGDGGDGDRGECGVELERVGSLKGGGLALPISILLWK